MTDEILIPEIQATATLNGGVVRDLQLDDSGTYVTTALDTGRFTEAIAFLLVSDHTDALGTLDVKMQLSPDQENWVDAGDAFAQVTTSNALTMKKLTANFGKYVRFHITLAGTAPDFTFTLFLVVKN